MAAKVKMPQDHTTIRSEGLSLDLIKTSPLEFVVITVAGSCLACAAGFVNATTLLGVTELESGIKVSFYTSHMTGTTTGGSISLGWGRFDDFAEHLCLIVSFSTGAFFVGAFSSAASKSWEIGPTYAPLFFILSVILGAACVAAYVNPSSFVYYYLVAMAMGFQNSLTSKYSGSLIRTTHMTGTLTDIGLILGQWSRGVNKDLWKLPVLVSLVCSFAAGAVLASETSDHKLSIIYIAAFYLIVAVTVQVFISYSRRQAFWRVLVGAWDVKAPSHDEEAHDANEAPSSLALNPMHGGYDALVDPPADAAAKC